MRVEPIHVLVIATLVIAGGTLASDLAPFPQHENVRLYVNHEFGFSVELPFYAPTCDPSQDNQETGFVFFLDAGDSDCPTGMPDRRWISFHEGYNTAEYASTRDVAGRLCDHGMLSPTDPKLFGKLDAWLPLTCREAHTDGLILYSMYALSSDGLSTYEVRLQTAPETFESDRAVLLATMRTLKRFEPDPSDVRGTGWAAILSRELKKEAAENGGTP